MQTRRPIIGLAGGIGAGKSAVASILAELGCVVSDADALARKALEDPHIKQTLVQWWGDEVLSADGSVNRSAIAAIVFADAEQRTRLEALTHPWIGEQRVKQFKDAPADAVALVIDAPLLFEAEIDQKCDAVIFVEASRQTRLERVHRTRGWDEAELTRREDSQLSLDEKRQRADYVVVNDDVDRVRLTERVGKVLRAILSGR